MEEKEKRVLPLHQRLIDDSAISPEVAKARGYWSATTKAELKDLGFSDAQCRVPALIIPVFSVTGEVALHQIRPDAPRSDKDGKAIRYETPSKARMALDVHPAIRQYLSNPKRPLFITEGIRKADSAVSHNLCCLALLGVWNWRGSNAEGGKLALPDWDSIALNERETFLVFDSDVMFKESVHKALSRLKAFLESRKALVRLVYLEPKEDGTKVGLDDFFAAGHTLQELIARATDTLQSGQELEHPFPYKETPRGLVWLKPTKDGTVETPLCNFTARITSDLIEDDGVETKRLFEVEATQGLRKATIKLPAERFFSMAWPAEALGSQAIIAPGTLIKDHARVAIQLHSQNSIERHVYTHLGWRKIGEHRYYLHAGGAIGPQGADDSVEVSVPSALERYVLPDPPGGEARKTAIRASLHFLDVAPPQITFSLLSAAYRAPLGESDLSAHLCGPTGEGKTELAARIQQHHGAELDARHLPGSWSSTGNSLEGLAFAAKDALLTVDDFAPTGSTADVQRFHREADRLFRAQGNRAGRQRMRSDATLRAAKPPRGLILSTGEDVPKGQSLRSRIYILEVSPGDVDWMTMSVCQEHAAQGLYAQALAGFVQWLAPRYDTVKNSLRTEISELRHYTQANHKRTPDIVANLAIGFRYFLHFAVDSEAITGDEQEKLWEHCWQALAEAATAQAKYQEASEPARRFIELLTAALASGKAHVASHTGAYPSEAEAWGWRVESTEHGWQSHGARAGWINGDDLYLEPDASFAIAQEFAKAQGDSLPVTPQTLRKRLKEQGYLASYGGANRETLMVRRTLEGKTLSVLHLRKSIFLEGLSSYKKPDKPDIDQEQPADEQQTEANVRFSEPQHEAKPDKPDIDLTEEIATKTNTSHSNVRNVRFPVGGESSQEEKNGRVHFQRKTHVRNVRFPENENLTSEEKNPTKEQ